MQERREWRKHDRARRKRELRCFDCHAHLNLNENDYLFHLVGSSLKLTHYDLIKSLINYFIAATCRNIS